tara:strand:- start:499 stop:1383 length:885 start_codon:yes stop_codon:yes gene_type:complete
MKKVVYVLFSIFLAHALSAGEVKNKIYDSAAEQISHGISKLIPGEGVTEVSVEVTDEKSHNPDISILAVRDILSRDNSNIFTQFSVHNTEVNGDTRYVGNIGLGYRFLTPDNSYMYGINSFYDQDFKNDHARASVGLEARAKMIDVSVNKYQKVTDMLVVRGNEEQVLNGYDYNISSQLPYMPWALFNYKGYNNEKEKASEDSEGRVFSLELAINPALQLDLSLDDSTTTGVDDVLSAEVNLVYPPKDKEFTMIGGLSENKFETRDMSDELSDKVRRNNKLTVEIQGAVIITSK